MDMTNEIPSVVVKEILFNDNKKIKFNKDDIVLLVGGNNVGKSRTLKDLKDDLNQIEKSRVLIKEVEYESTGISKASLEEYFERNYKKENPKSYRADIDGVAEYFYTEDFENIKNQSNYYKILFSLLSTENRLNITKPINYSLLYDPQNLQIMDKLDKDSESIKTLNEALSAGFQQSIEVFEDRSNVVQLMYKIGESKTILEAIESNKRSNHEKLEQLEDLHDQGDGIRNAVAVLASLIVSEHSLFLIDEPESFLHPPQARILGKNIVQLSENKQLFISTHNIDFIRGLLEENSQRVKIIKINRDGNENTFNLVDNDSIERISEDKNLKYTNILNGLFYKQVILCENESDCKFYSAILEQVNPLAYQNSLFCAVGGKEQFKKVVPLLEKLRIEYKIIADIDLINNADTVSQLLNSIDSGCADSIRKKHIKFIKIFNKETHGQLKTQEEIKKEINELFTTEIYMPSTVADKMKSLLKKPNNLNLLKKEGKGTIPQGECTDLFDDINSFLKDKNIFILECGEIEQFIPGLGGHGNKWVENVFEEYPDIENEIYDSAKEFIEMVFK